MTFQRGHRPYNKIESVTKPDDSKATDAPARDTETTPVVEAKTEPEQTPVVHKERPKRIPLHRQAKEAVPQREGFHRRWVTERPTGHYKDRIKKFQDAGYTIVHEPGLSDRERGIERPSQIDSMTAMPGRDGTRRVLMEIPKEYYAQDQADKQAILDEQEKKRVTPDIPNRYGGIQIEH
ncbi:MAG: hypothetical protein PHU23_10980 [Dehalococcoidales bacterium]|nr:hypothetical protein [Dehalococcoidales bacterium]